MTIVTAKDVVYGSVLGAGLVADIAFKRNKPGALPAVISIHGGRWIRGTRSDDGKEGRPNNGVIDLRQWAEAGFFAMRIDYRLVTCSPAPACFQDAMCAVRWVHAHAEEYGVNQDQIFLIGQSAGGHLASLAATGGPEIYEQTGGWEASRSDVAAAISISGAYDLLTLDWGSGWCPPGIPWDVARKHASPIQNATRSNRPILVVHAENDPSVPIIQADTFVQKLREVGASHAYCRYDTGGHLCVTETVFEQCHIFIKNVIAGAV
jgi:acetyl esterase/lipase